VPAATAELEDLANRRFAGPEKAGRERRFFGVLVWR
jgi:hypothetical protein